MPGEVDEALAALRLFDFGRPREQGIQVAVSLNELGRGFHADAGDAGNVVRGIAGQGLYVNHTLRAHAEFVLHFGRADPPVLEGVEHAHTVGYQLHQVLVRGHDHDVEPVRLGASRIGGDQVVRFEPGPFETGHVEGPRGLSHQRELGDQFVGRVRAVGFVLGKNLVPKGLPGRIENHGHVRGLHVVQQFEQHVGKPEDGVHGRPVRPGQHRERVERPEQETGPVHQTQSPVGSVSMLRRRHRQRVSSFPSFVRRGEGRKRTWQPTQAEHSIKPMMENAAPSSLSVIDMKRIPFCHPCAREDPVSFVFTDEEQNKDPGSPITNPTGFSLIAGDFFWN